MSNAWMLKKRHQWGILSQVIAQEYGRLLPSHTISANITIMTDDDMYITVSREYHLMTAPRY